MTFTNRGATTCHLTGYPGLSFIDAAGVQIGPAAQHYLAAHSTVTLANGATGFAQVGVGNPGVVNCTGVHPYQIRVYPPNETVPILVKPPTALIVCPDARLTPYVNPVLDHPGL